jgi:hypothetical protein
VLKLEMVDNVGTEIHGQSNGHEEGGHHNWVEIVAEPIELAKNTCSKNFFKGIYGEFLCAS